ncbi:unnamed protein product [Protopolystoma xenopodis]|uniref:Uncharacterized protein n=1 Tax=Protopolystoma xenopodis TaxID=117903 RepID=A0A448WAI1_9PLAT|nr:unnamed protein product [Protopolystoma xenopodis]
MLATSSTEFNSSLISAILSLTGAEGRNVLSQRLDDTSQPGLRRHFNYDIGEHYQNYWAQRQQREQQPGLDEAFSGEDARRSFNDSFNQARNSSSQAFLLDVTTGTVAEFEGTRASAEVRMETSTGVGAKLKFSIQEILGQNKASELPLLRMEEVTPSSEVSDGCGYLLNGSTTGQATGGHSMADSSSAISSCSSCYRQEEEEEVEGDDEHMEEEEKEEEEEEEVKKKAKRAVIMGKKQMRFSLAKRHQDPGTTTLASSLVTLQPREGEVLPSGPFQIGKRALSTCRLERRSMKLASWENRSRVRQAVGRRAELKRYEEDGQSESPFQQKSEGSEHSSVGGQLTSSSGTGACIYAANIPAKAAAQMTMTTCLASTETIPRRGSRRVEEIEFTVPSAGQEAHQEEICTSLELKVPPSQALVRQTESGIDEYSSLFWKFLGSIDVVSLTVHRYIQN